MPENIAVVTKDPQREALQTRLVADAYLLYAKTKNFLIESAQAADEGGH